MGRRKLIGDAKDTGPINTMHNETINSESLNGNNMDKQENSECFDIEKEFQKLYDQALRMGLTNDDLERLNILNEIKWNGSYMKIFLRYLLIFIVVIGVVYMSIVCVFLFDWPVQQETLVQAWMKLYGADIDSEQCVISMPEMISDIFRPPVECSFCVNVTEVKTVYNISQDEFEELYAYTGVPVIIGDGTVNWTAPDHFSFEFFQEIYKEGSQALENQERNCQYFPYKTSFQRLGEVMSMSRERARMEDGSEPWYIGWSNCDFSAANTLRSHYKRPYFLPKLSESSRTDWMFMGSPGYGANLHIDHVGNPSWQAQITGTKRWTLEPPPECYFTCADRIEVTVHPGQIIVLDTNIWYHATLNVGKDISITIGSEYD